MLLPSWLQDADTERAPVIPKMPSSEKFSISARRWPEPPPRPETPLDLSRALNEEGLPNWLVQLRDVPHSQSALSRPTDAVTAVEAEPDGLPVNPRHVEEPGLASEPVCPDDSGEAMTSDGGTDLTETRFLLIVGTTIVLIVAALLLYNA
jgi:hypothetical protein